MKLNKFMNEYGMFLFLLIIVVCLFLCASNKEYMGLDQLFAASDRRETSDMIDDITENASEMVDDVVNSSYDDDVVNSSYDEEYDDDENYESDDSDEIEGEYA